MSDSPIAKLFRQPTIVTALTYEDGLHAARSAIAKEASKFAAAPIFGFSKYTYFLGISKAFMTVYIAGRWPQHFWLWHMIQFFVLAPLQAYRWTKMKGLSYFMEFCWVANIAMAFYFALSCFGALNSLTHGTRAMIWRGIFAFGSGPLGGAVVLLGNALVPHSIDYTMSLLIHLQPSVTAYCVRWGREGGGKGFLWYSFDASALFPTEQEISFGEYVAPPLAFLLAWALVHTVLMLSVGDRLEAAGQKTTYQFNLKAKSGKNAFTKVLGSPGDGGSEVVRFLKYEVISVALNAAVIALTYPLYKYGTADGHFALLMLTCLVSAWNGAGWYEYRLKSLVKCVEDLDAAKAPVVKAHAE